MQEKKRQRNSAHIKPSQMDIERENLLKKLATKGSKKTLNPKP